MCIRDSNRTVWSRKVYINRTNQSQLKLHFKWTSNKLQCNHHGNDNEVSEAEILNKITKWRYRGRPILLITLMVTTDCDSLILALLIIFFCIFPFFSFFSSFISFTEQVFKTIMNANTYKFNSDISKEALKPSTLH